MLASMVGNVLLRQVPDQLMAGVQSGDLKIYGSIVRSWSSGRIVGHLQETSGLSRLAGELLSSSSDLPIPGLGTAVDLAGHAVSFVQNEQIKHAIGVLQNLQVASLALGVAGIGVSVAGFAVLNARIGRVEDKVDAIGGKLDQLSRNIDSLRRDRIADDFTRLRTVCEQMEEGWNLTDPASQWRQVATESHVLANIFERRAADLLERDDAGVAEAEPFLEALALSAGTRVKARLAAGDDLVALRAAQEGARAVVCLGEGFKSGDAVMAVARRSADVFGSQAWAENFEKGMAPLSQIVTAARVREAALASTVLTLEELNRQQISGRAWLEAARAETGEPILYLSASAD